jgi:hypothetical protein
MRRYYVLYRFTFGTEWILYNARRGGMTRKEMKGIIQHLKDDPEIETKVLTEPLFNLLRK